ncbi:hypothetical protein [Arthrobacter sp. MYb51]|uniref:hypothetical protein n=1 Tax=Arthrobacter sp. MYb51 TaxID=1848604 RepID=UPI001C615421|nr:hypothetical protein [Arthrobacter sp. MYb51]
MGTIDMTSRRRVRSMVPGYSVTVVMAASFGYPVLLDVVVALFRIDPHFKSIEFLDENAGVEAFG